MKPFLHRWKLFADFLEILERDPHHLDQYQTWACQELELANDCLCVDLNLDTDLSDEHGSEFDAMFETYLYESIDCFLEGKVW